MTLDKKALKAEGKKLTNKNVFSILFLGPDDSLNLGQQEAYSTRILEIIKIILSGK